MDFIKQFCDAIAAACGAPPASAADIKADDKWNRTALRGDKKKDLRYQLKIDGDFAIGRFIYSKEGKAHNWHSKASRKFTPEERKAWKIKMEAEKKAQAERQAQEWAAVAEECQNVWRQAKAAEEHPYCTKKGISAEGARVADLKDDEGKIQKNILLIPVYKNNRISSLQRIWPNGFKAFWPGGDVAGGYAVLATPEEPKDVIFIVEGWATGKTVRAAMNKPVIIAFNAGNLLPVAQIMREKYPDAKIIIAADNDQWTLVNGKIPPGIDPKEIPGDDERWNDWGIEGRLYNPGLDKALQAAVKIRAHVLAPKIPRLDKDKRTDWNDLHASEGIDAVASGLLVSTPVAEPPGREISEHPHLLEDLHPAGGDSEIDEESLRAWADTPTPIEAYGQDAAFQVSLYAAGEKEKNDDWKSKLYYKDDGTLEAKSLSNARLFIENDRILSNLFCYNKFSHEKIVYRCPPWEDPAAFKPRPMKDDDVTFLTVELERRGIKQTFSTVKQLLSAVIRGNARNPAQEYLNSLKWDNKPRLDNWLIYYAGAEFDNQEYVRSVGSKWAIALVARVLNPGCKYDHMLILEGGQRIGKSRIAEKWATIRGEKYFDNTISVADLSNPATVPKLQGVLVIEIQEMSGFHRKDADEMKKILSISEDRIVRKYESEATAYPRQFVFIGTINPKNGYLHDPTGNSRFWPVKCGRKVDIEAFERDKEQLLAEAVHRYKSGEIYWADDRLLDLTEAAQESRKVLHPWYADLEELVHNKDGITNKDIWTHLGITDKTKRTRQASEEVDKIMVMMGFEPSRRRFTTGQSPEYGWVRSIKPEPEEEIEWEK